jgi:hypothetical protein
MGNIMMDLREMELVQDKDKWNAVMNLPVP